MSEKGVLKWNVDDIAKALKIRKKDVQEYFTDGRRISFLIERRVAREVLLGQVAKSEGAGFDIVDSKGHKWEVRSVSRGGVYFCPSYMVGSGRNFDEKGFLEKLNEIEGYVLADIESFPNVPFWIVPVEHVKDWYEKGLLGAGTKVSRETALNLLAEKSK